MDTATALITPTLGQYWPGQGGIYLGPHILGGHTIAAVEHLPESFEFGGYGTKLAGYSDIDGAENTRKLIERGGHPAAAAAAAHTADGHTDFYLPSHREILQLLVVMGFDPEGGWTWTATPYGSCYAWVVDFEDGGVGIDHRRREFRVRPFRRSSI